MSESREPRVNVSTDVTGNLILTSGYEPLDAPSSLAELLLNQADKLPNRVLLAEKNSAGEYETLTYAEVTRQAFAVATWLLQDGAGQETPLMILSGASRAHLVISLGAMLAQVPTVPTSMSYSSIEAAYPKLRAIFDKTKPQYVFSDNFESQLSSLQATGISSESLTFIGESTAISTVPLSQLLAQTNQEKVLASVASIGWDTVFKYMFTSGSTGQPKGVIHDHGMMCSMLAAGDPARNATPPRVLDWMPWSHVGAGVMRIAMIIESGGSIYIDDGKPVPGEYDKTLKNLAEVKPTMYAGAPLGWNMLVQALEQDEKLAQAFFENVESLGYGSAAMPTSTYDRLQDLLVKYQGARRAMSTSLQSTEVAVGLSRYWPCEDQTVVGLPMPGAELKLLPVGDRYELRVRSRGVTPGYIQDVEKTQDAFDDQGFFKMGDAVTFADPEDPAKGLRFAGRIAEQFKLVTGTWVAAGTLRALLVAACAPYVRDVVICGLNQPYLAALMWLNVESASQLAGTSDPTDQIVHDLVLAQLKELLAQHNAQHSASSQRISRFMLLAEPPSIGGGEITEKGYINQGAVQQTRVGAVEALFKSAPPPGVNVVT